MIALGRMSTHVLKGATASILVGLLNTAYAEQPPAPCHPNPNAADDRDVVAKRGDIANLPKPLKDRLIRLADRRTRFCPYRFSPRRISQASYFSTTYWIAPASSLTFSRKYFPE